jgi:two-component system, chemotaxis family, protein-glutamate methylesterase/glutaminase
MMQTTDRLIVMGGSWGGIQASLQVLQALPATYSIPIVLVLHRLRNHEGSLQELFSKKVALTAVEIEDKEPILPGHLYIAPANYHVLLEKEHIFSLDDSELENYSRPSIDITFSSAADVYGANTVGILLSGASKDGSAGLKAIFEKNGIAIAQNPGEAEVATMPLAAIQTIRGCKIMNVEDIKAYLLSLHEY